MAEAKIGRRAASIPKEQNFNLMVLDLAMPELNGVDVVCEIGQETKHRAMPLIIMTANPHMAIEEVEQEADFVRHKPINIIGFSVFVRRLAERLH